MVSISGCDPLDPGSNPGTAITLFYKPRVAAVLFADGQVFVAAYFEVMKQQKRCCIRWDSNPRHQR